ncbi:MAG: universal stress protein [Halorientalis sp.]
MYESILFAADRSDHADRVAEHAIDIAQQRDAALHVLSVVDDRAFLVLDDERVEEVRADLEADAHEAIDNAVTNAQSHGIDATAAVDVGHPAECIVDYAADNDIDLIVMGTSGDNYERNVVGSVSKRVVETSPVPVLTVGLDA